MSVIRTRGLRHRFDDRIALDGLDLDWPEHQVVCVLGPNGSGKSTLFRILSTSLVPTEGRVQVLGYDVRTDAQSIRRSLGSVFQFPALDPELTMAENLQVFAALHGVERRQAAARISDLLDELNISDRAGERVSRLSGGLRRRADLARSLIHGPKLLLLDEPTSGLDPTARARFWESVARLRQSRPLSILLSTHSFDEAAACDHLVILDRGRIAVEGHPADLIRALGQEALWIETDDPESVRAALLPEDTLDGTGRRLRVTGSDLTRSLIRLREHAGDRIGALEIRPPGLSDVYETATGRRWTQGQDAEAVS